MQVPDVNGILDRLLLFLGYEKDYVTAETLIQVGGGRVELGSGDRSVPSGCLEVPTLCSMSPASAH